MTREVLICFPIKNVIIDVVAYQVHFIILAWHDNLLICLKYGRAHQFESSVNVSYADYDLFHVLIDILSRHVGHTLQKRNQLPKFKLIQEIFEFFALEVGEVI